MLRQKEERQRLCSVTTEKAAGESRSKELSIGACSRGRRRIGNDSGFAWRVPVGAAAGDVSTLSSLEQPHVLVREGKQSGDGEEEIRGWKRHAARSKFVMM